jgi:signal transduction histidine kinase
MRTEPATSTVSKRHRAWVLIAAMVLLAVAGYSAAQSLGRPFASVFVDPFGDYSAVHLPSWGTGGWPFRAGDRIAAVDGQSVEPSATALEAALEAAHHRGAHSVHLRFVRGAALYETLAPIRAITWVEVWWFFGLYALLGLSFLWSGLVVWRIASGRAATVAYVATTVNAFAFLACFFDYHTTQSLTPVFAATSLGNALGVLALAITFPSVPRWVSRSSPLFIGVFAAGVAAMLALGLSAAFSYDARPLRLAVNALVPASLGVLAVATAARFWERRGVVRRELRGLTVSFGVLPLAIAGAAVSDQLFDTDVLPLTLPLVGLIVPSGIGLSLIRSDFLRTGAVLTRWLLMVPVGFAGVALACSAFAWTRGEAASVSVASVLSVVTFALTMLVGWWAFTRLFFRGQALYRPTVRQLAERLATVHDAAAIRSNLGEVAGRLSADLSALVVDEVEAFERWPRLVTEGPGSFWDFRDEERSWVTALRSGDRFLGALVLAGPRQGAPLTSDDIAVLETLTSLAALALHNALTLRELEQLRQWESGASREDKRLSVDLLAAEVAHEVAYPLTYFRHFLGRLKGGHVLASDDIDIGQEEVRRLERMLSSVRRLRRPTPTLKSVELRPVVERAIALLREDFDDRQQRVELAVDSVRVRADADQLLQVFTNLLRNAAQASDEGGRLGVTSRRGARGLELTVWNTGPEVPEADRVRLFSPWFTTRSDGTGLGLAVTQRIVRSFDWSIEVERRDACTCFVIYATEVERSSS